MDIMEERMRGGDIPHLAAFNLALALKYILRAGKKEGQSWRKDIDKARNYLHRASTGRWLPDGMEELDGVTLPDEEQSGGTTVFIPNY